MDNNGQLHIKGFQIDWDVIETDSYQVTEMFINNREQILHRLLDVKDATEDE